MIEMPLPLSAANERVRTLCETRQRRFHLPLLAMHTDRFATRGLVIVTEKMQDTVNQQSLQLLAQRMSSSPCLASGGLDRDNHVPQ